MACDAAPCEASGRVRWMFLSDGAVIPGMQVAMSGADVPVRVWRSGANAWWAMVGAGSGAIAEEVCAAASAQDAPSSLLEAAGAHLTTQQSEPITVTLARIELDVCGAWMTVANATPARPILVRRAGWVDVRGHPGRALGGLDPFEPADDRIGLGPGDAVVLQCCGLAGDGDGVEGDDDEAMLDSLLSVAGQSPQAIVDATIRSNRGPEATVVADSAVVIAVPPDLGPDPQDRIVDATGIGRADLQLPGYPLGDLQPELWREPPRPPRLARLALAADGSSVRGVRQLLDRLLSSWRLDGRVDDDGLKLAASELAANAVLHAGTPVTATIRYLGATVRVEIDDQSPVLPKARTAGRTDTGGRGLPLVDTLSDAWGVNARPNGKRVWCEVAVAGFSE